MLSNEGVLNPDLVRHVMAGSGLSEPEAIRLIDDVLAWFREPVDELVRRRHRELKLVGWRNDAIYAQIETELRDRLVQAPPLSERQIRRLIYG